jgi:cold shock CspA family protein
MAIGLEASRMDYIPSWSEGFDHERADRAPSRRKTSRRPMQGRAKGAKPEERGRRMTGRIARMMYGQSYGLIRVSDGREVFFHRKDAPDALFNALEVKDSVVFELIEDAIAGPRAVRVARPESHRRRQELT